MLGSLSMNPFPNSKDGFRSSRQGVVDGKAKRIPPKTGLTTAIGHHHVTAARRIRR